MQTYHVPFAFAAVPQEPVNIPEKPAGGPTGPGAPSGAAGTTAPPAGAQQPAPGACGGTEMFIMMPAMLLIMYFLVLRPEQKRRKEQQTLLASIKQGDRVVTVGGMHGVVTKLTDKTVTLRVDTLQMTFDRVAIARVERDDAGTAPVKA
jgi:preprotein translocase subunit YajC